MKKFYFEDIGTYNNRSSDDLYSALEYNEAKVIKPNEVKTIMAEVPGHNDEDNWWWVLELANGRYGLMSAGCDYTGWDCGSSISHESLHDTAIKAAEAAPIIEEYGTRNIQKNLVRQLKANQPFATYEVDYGKK